MGTGRYAPSPSGDLHVGNLRTALLAWLFATHAGSSLRLRIDDLDPAVTDRATEARQVADLEAIGLRFDAPWLRQSERSERYEGAIERLVAAELVYPCFCSRREVREAAQAPHEHLPDGAYPGTCTTLTVAERRSRARTRPAALRVRAEAALITFSDRVHAEHTGVVDDFVVRRNDGIPAYNLATVVDDADQGVEEVVRGDDLLAGTARQIWLRRVLELEPVTHAHVPLVLNADGARLAKRDGAVTLADLAALGRTADDVRSELAATLGLAEPGESITLREMLARFTPAAIPRLPHFWPGGPPRGGGSPDQKNASETV